MSEIMLSPTVAGVNLVAEETSQPSTPSWLSEVLLLEEYWRTTGLLERLRNQVQVHRGRMGQYEVCDFVLLLLAYAVSGIETLERFFEQLKCVRSVVMSGWQRQDCPVASTLSRFLKDIDSIALEQLRTLFEVDLLDHSFPQPHNGGLSDRSGQHFWVFDVDGTHQVTRQRRIVNDDKHPNPQRRSQAANAKGYLGRRRGEATRTRSAISQAHTSEWLGTFGAPGNGTPGPDLQQACRVIQDYLQHHDLSGEQAVVRLDGFYGVPKYVIQIQQHQLGYLLRSRDYGLLKLPELQACLQASVPESWAHPDAPQKVRDVFDLGFVDDRWVGYVQPVRLIVLRATYDPKLKYSVGKRIGEFIYELFVTSLPQQGLTGCDVLSLYYGRGGFEKVLGDEDVEQDCDRWCSWNPYGQEFWQILSQWVWNWRLWAGFAHHSQPVRTTIWVPPQDENTAVSTSPSPSGKPLPLSRQKEAAPIDVSTQYGPMQVAGGWAKSLNKFSGNDFTILDERTLTCPAGHPMHSQETRQDRRGNILIMFGLNPHMCQECPLKSQCLADGSKGTRGRRITVIREKLFTSPLDIQQTPQTPLDIQQTPQTQPIHNITPNIQLTQPVLWLDLPTTRLRRDLKHQLRQQQIIIDFIDTTTPTNTTSSAEFITRDQRAHRRLSWTQRFEKNAIKEAVAHWNVKLFGISSAILDWLHRLKPKPPVII